MESHLNVIRHKKKEIKDQSIKCFRVSPNANTTTRLVKHVAEFFEPKNKTEQTRQKKIPFTYQMLQFPMLALQTTI